VKEKKSTFLLLFVINEKVVAKPNAGTPAV
jgi:hypothetical protein